MNRVNQAVYFLGLFLWCALATADEADTELPSLELLEFLGEAEKIDGEWLDPLNMIELQPDRQMNRQQENQDNE